MASFNDLPQDVLWLIFRKVIVCTISTIDLLILYEEDGYYKANSFNSDFHGYVLQTIHLALINKKSLKLIRSKCVKRKYIKNWWFIKGALTQKYK